MEPTPLVSRGIAIFRLFALVNVYVIESIGLSNNSSCYLKERFAAVEEHMAGRLKFVQGKAVRRK